MKRFILFTFVALIFTSCAKDNSPITITLDSVPALNTGYYVAHSKSFLPTDEVDVKFVYPLIEPTFQPLVDGRSNIVSATLNEAIIAESHGLDLVNILQLSQSTPLKLITRDSIATLKDLSGKKLGYLPADGSKEIIDLVSVLKGVQFELVSTDALTQFQNGQIDAIVLKEYKEMQQITGIVTNEVSLYDFDQMGFDIPDKGLYCLKSDYKKRKADYDAIAESVQRGWEWTADNLSDAFVILCNNLGETTEEDRSYYFWQLDRFSAQQTDPIANERIYTLFEETVEAYCELYKAAGIIEVAVEL